MDTSFITNEPGQTLKDRFRELIKDCKYFDALVGYFCISGFHQLQDALQNTERIRILIGLGTDLETIEILSSIDDKDEKLSHVQVKERIAEKIEREFENSRDSKEVEEGVLKFVELLKEGKLHIRAYPSRKLHAKVYIMKFREGDRDVGRVITGSSNLTRSGLEDNLEFNVELKDPRDFEYASKKFEELWKESVDLKDAILQAIKERTWLNDTITPYELFLKLLYEYFKDDLELDVELFEEYFPKHFKRLEYQRQAVINAKKIIEEYGGVFISDVVGLGKTYITALLLKQLEGRVLVIAPPALIKENNPGSWPNVFADFNIRADFVSTGKLEEAKQKDEERDYHIVVIDESHRFRNESTISYDIVSEVCYGKKVILVSATPYNNSPKDLLNQIKLFQNPRNSDIPGVRDLEGFFNHLQSQLEEVDKKNNYEEYLEVSRKIANKIREKVLKYIMVRRTRTEIEKYFPEDLKNNNIKFPRVEPPKPLLYQLTEEEEKIFDETLRLITQEFTYARYKSLLYLKKGITPLEEQGQKNLGGFMKVLLVKRMESSFNAFKKTIDRFIEYYDKFIRAFEQGKVYISKKYSTKLLDLWEEQDLDKIQSLLEEEKAQEYESTDFNEEFYKDLTKDFEILKTIKSMWERVGRDPKIDLLLDKLEKDPILSKHKIVIFTESKETAEYVAQRINSRLGKIALVFHGSSKSDVREEVIANFDPRKKRRPKNDYRILVTTDVLAEGVNLHKSNVVINYDIPWNPTKLIQRVGRVNRIDTTFDTIHIYNFFPTRKAEGETDLLKIARAKIEQFLTLLGGDAAILTEGEPVSSHELFDKLISSDLFKEDEGDESELRYLRIIEDVRDNNKELYDKIKKLPKKARSGKIIRNDSTQGNDTTTPTLITFFRKGKLMKFYKATQGDSESEEINFITAAKIFECQANEKKAKIEKDTFYELLKKNMQAFEQSLTEEYSTSRRLSNIEKKILEKIKAVKNISNPTEEQIDFLEHMFELILNGILPKGKIKKINFETDKLKEEEYKNAENFIKILKRCIPPKYLMSSIKELVEKEEKREVILSLYLGVENE